MNWQDSINNFKNYLNIERGLSTNSIKSYENDLNKFLKFLQIEKNKYKPDEVTTDLIKEFIYDISKKLKSSSQSRIISGIRNFYDYLIFENIISNNPVDNIELPKIEKKLPNILSIEEINNSNVTWILDPIDRTTNFINGFPHYCISLCASVEGVLTHGVIIDPSRREEFSASKGKGAQLNGERIRVSAQKSLTDALLSCSSRSTPEQDYKYNLLGTFMQLYKNEITVRRTGCSALDLAYVAAGRLDGFFHNKINIWDIAAGILIVQEAGGKVNDINKSYINNIDIRASNNNIYNKMLENLKNF